MKLSPGVKALVIANALIFAFTFFIPGLRDQMVHWFSLAFPTNERFQYWQLVTTMFMHGSLAHIFFNMFALSSFGSLLEFRWGLKRFLVFYFVAGIGASVIYTAVNYTKFVQIHSELAAAGLSGEAMATLLSSPLDQSLYQAILSFSERTGIDPLRIAELHSLFNSYAVGASGAIYGVLVAFGILYPNAKLFLIFFPVPIAAKYFVPGLICIDLFSGVTGVSLFGGGIAHFAHIGGAIIGFLLMLLWRKRGDEVDPRASPIY